MKLISYLYDIIRNTKTKHMKTSAHKITKFRNEMASGYLYREVEIESEADGLPHQKFFAGAFGYFRTLSDAKAAIDNKKDNK